MRPENIPDISLFSHTTPLQLRFSDVDVLGHVNNTVYFAFYDTGKAHFFNALMDGAVDWQHVETVIANVDCCYIRPIVFSDEIEVLTRCKAIGDRSFTLQQVIRERNRGEIMSACETVMAGFDPATQTCVPIPDRWKQALAKSMTI